MKREIWQGETLGREKLGIDQRERGANSLSHLLPQHGTTDYPTGTGHRTQPTIPCCQSCLRGCVPAGKAEGIQQCFREAARCSPGVTWSLRFIIIEDTNPQNIPKKSASKEQRILTCYKTFIQLLEKKGNFVYFSQSDLDVFQHDALLLL